MMVPETAESVNAILEGMTWLGLEYDEGPFYQTQRFDRYKEVIAQMLEQGRVSDELLKHPHMCFVALQKLFQAVCKLTRAAPQNRNRIVLMAHSVKLNYDETLAEIRKAMEHPAEGYEIQNEEMEFYA